MATSIEVRIPLDSGGFLHRECPSCIREFMSRIAEADEQPTYFCPYCGVEAAADSWWTPAQLEHLRAVAMDALTESVRRELNRGVRTSASRSNAQKRASSLASEDTALSVLVPMRALAVACHSRVAVKVLDDFQSKIHCFVCGSVEEELPVSGLYGVENPDMTPEDITQRDRDRESVLRVVHDLTGGDRHVMLSDEEIQGQTGLTSDACDAALEYLSNQGLVKNMSIGGAWSLTHRGLQAYENLIRRPAKPEARALAAPVVQNFNGPVGSVQTGNNNIANVVLNQGNSAAEVLELLASIREYAQSNPTIEGEVIEHIDDIKSEVEGAKKPSKIKAGLLALWSGTKSVVELAPKVIALAQKFGVQFPPH